MRANNIIHGTTRISLMIPTFTLTWNSCSSGAWHWPNGSAYTSTVYSHIAPSNCISYHFITFRTMYTISQFLALKKKKPSSTTNIHWKALFENSSGSCLVSPPPLPCVVARIAPARRDSELVVLRFPPWLGWPINDSQEEIRTEYTLVIYIYPARQCWSLTSTYRNAMFNQVKHRICEMLCLTLIQKPWRCGYGSATKSDKECWA